MSFCFQLLFNCLEVFIHFAMHFLILLYDFNLAKQKKTFAQIAQPETWKIIIWIGNF